MLIESARRWFRDTAPLVGFWLVVSVYYVFVTTAGHFTRWHVWSGFYDVQADALLHGQLHLLEQPSRALLALKDPYDLANMPYWRWDHLFYNGHLYHYWGIVPAFLVAGIRLIFRAGGPADNVLTFAFFVARLVAGTLLIRHVARRATPRPPKWAVAAAMLVFALANPTPYTLARGAIYEAAIMAGVAFMTAGLYCGYRAMYAPGGRAATAWLAAASLGFGLAAGSRLNLMPTAVALAVLGTLWRWWQTRSQGPARLAAPARSAGVRPPERTTVAHRACGAGRLAATGVAGLVPAGAVMLGLLIINKLRFGDWTDFGRDYAMTYPLFVPGLRFLLPNTYAYAFAPPQWGCTFPYLSLAWSAVRPLTPAWVPLTWPADHFTPEPTIGLLTIAPFFWFALLAPLIAIARARLMLVAEPARPGRWAALLAAPANWLWAALAIYLLGAAPLLILNVTTMRYEHDFATGLLLIAIFTSWKVLAAPLPRAARRAIAWLYGLLAVSTIVAGVLLGFTGYFKHFERHNPALLRTLEKNLSVCRLTR
jgi:hypothetical protein